MFLNNFSKKFSNNLSRNFFKFNYSFDEKVARDGQS
jgi:hypothetical protein